MRNKMLLAASSLAVVSCLNRVQWARSRGIIAGKEGEGEEEHGACKLVL
jgi:hypothetical protein